MTTESIYGLFCDLSLRQHIIDTAKMLTTNRKWQKDLVGHAWFRLGETDGQKTIEFYKMMAGGAMKTRLMLLIYKEVVIT